ncbi:hypothetical protein GE061_001589 [Apolygus lucorum]|uniref:Uncharacterized protein n=1 Tax=Apolygus lucorum TaxID=248454 RepID=A0A6A4KBG6_APOLU|nr:hypothetical protein GE061_001589 [Apolygus lucorum]
MIYGVALVVDSILKKLPEFMYRSIFGFNVMIYREKKMYEITSSLVNETFDHTCNVCGIVGVTNTRHPAATFCHFRKKTAKRIPQLRQAHKVLYT